MSRGKGGWGRRLASGALTLALLLAAGCHEGAAPAGDLGAPVAEWTLPFTPAEQITDADAIPVELTKVLINLLRAADGEYGYQFFQRHARFAPSRAAWAELRQVWLRVQRPPEVRLVQVTSAAGLRDYLVEVRSGDPAVNGMVWVWRATPGGDLQLYDIRMPAG